MNVIVSAVLAMIEELLPLLDNSSVVAKVLTALEAIVPLVIKEYHDLVPLTKNIIGALQSNDAVSNDDWERLETMEQSIDSEFEAAANKADE